MSVSKKSKVLFSIRYQVAIAGQVTDAPTDQPIAGAEVIIKDAPPAFTSWLPIKRKQYGERWETMSRRPDRVRTAPDGCFYFVDLPAGTYTLTASLPGSGTRYGTAEEKTVTVPPNAKKVTVLNDGKTNRLAKTDTDNNDNANTNANLDVKLRLPPTTLKGKITNSEDEPVVMAKVRVLGSGEYAFTNAEGKYCLTGLEAGKRTVDVFFQGERKSFESVSLKAGLVESLNFTLETT